MTPELKELLTLAAKAAGYEVEVVGGGMMRLVAGNWYWWTPHVVGGRRDGLFQLFKLAQDAELVVDFGTCCVLCWVDGTASGAFDWNKGDNAGMCMAIVRAAAEKGRAM